MPQSNTRNLGLYDFFSVLLPGATLLLGVYPLFPENLELFSIGGVLTLIVLGFVLGRAVHSTAVGLYSFFGTMTHRQAFQNEIDSPEILNEKTVDRFCQEAKDAFSEAILPDTDSDEEIDTRGLYGCVRSYTHIDARGISRKFQAIYGFHRSTWLVIMLLGVTYFAYFFVVKGIEAGLVTPLNYTPKITGVTFPIELILASAIIGAGVSFQAFWVAMGRYRSTYVQYMITDFLALREIETRQPPPGQASPSTPLTSSTSRSESVDQSEQ